MPIDPSREPERSNACRGFVLVLICITAAAAIPALWLGSSQYIEYDGYWHVFIAQQDHWSRFWDDIRVNAHPPLFFLLLRVMLRFGHSLLVYRSISLAAGIASVFLVGWVARKVTNSSPRSWQSALLYGFALPAVIMACEVRSYMLSVFFVLLSFSFLLDVAGGDAPGTAGSRNQVKARAGFAIFAILACLSHYFAFFYCGAAMALLGARFVSRKTRGLATSWLEEAATLLPITGTILTLYLVHARYLAEIQGHLLPYYYDRAGHESGAAFLLRNSGNLLNLFAPWPISSDTVTLAVALLAMAGGIFALLVMRRLRDTVSASATWTLLITWMMLAMIALAALAGKYPFGGDLRQQYILFPFFLLCLAIVLERLVAPIAARVPRFARLLLNGLAAALIVAVGLGQFSEYPKSGNNVLADNVQTFDRVEPAPAVVYLDQFNLITFFIYHHDWNWKLEKRQPLPGIDIYNLVRGNQRILVLRDRERWNLDPEELGFYGQMARFLRTLKVLGITVFDVRQTPPYVPYGNVTMVRASISHKTRDAGLCLPQMWVDASDWFATLSLSGCAPAPEIPAAQPVTPSGRLEARFDGGSNSGSHALEFVGKWTRQTEPAAAGGTISSSSDPGAVVRLTFDGGKITCTFAKGSDRGIAAVRIDGNEQKEIDFYSEKFVPKASISYADLGQGKHTFELVVTGKKEPRATGTSIDFKNLSVQ
ncbi:MAG: glycosyltransferase family 39 protein [Acidobacteriota bacterium]|nr:glycosyltransferase family 39 protein [Acidobacteriota bacterium]